MVRAGQAEGGSERGAAGTGRVRDKCGSLVCRIRPGAGAGGLGHGRAPFGGGRCGENRENWLMSASGGRDLSPTSLRSWHVRGGCPAVAAVAAGLPGGRGDHGGDGWRLAGVPCTGPFFGGGPSAEARPCWMGSGRNAVRRSPVRRQALMSVERHKGNATGPALTQGHWVPGTG